MWELLIFVVLFWALPVWVGHQIGKPKNRMGWLWGLLLGWLGVIIVAVLPRVDPGLDLRIVDKDFVTFRPRIVTGAIQPGYTYGFRRSDQVLFRQATGSDQWVEVKGLDERADVLEALAQSV